MLQNNFVQPGKENQDISYNHKQSQQQYMNSEEDSNDNLQDITNIPKNSKSKVTSSMEIQNGNNQKLSGMIHELYKDIQKQLDKNSSEYLKSHINLSLDDKHDQFRKIDPIEIIHNLKIIFIHIIQAKKDVEGVLEEQNKSECGQYEESLQKLEAEVRQHIRIEQQLKLYAENTQEKLDDLQKQKDQQDIQFKDIAKKYEDCKKMNIQLVEQKRAKDQEIEQLKQISQIHSSKSQKSVASTAFTKSVKSVNENISQQQNGMIPSQSQQIKQQLPQQQQQQNKSQFQSQKSQQHHFQEDRIRQYNSKENIKKIPENNEIQGRNKRSVTTAHISSQQQQQSNSKAHKDNSSKYQNTQPDICNKEYVRNSVKGFEEKLRKSMDKTSGHGKSSSQIKQSTSALQKNNINHHHHHHNNNNTNNNNHNELSSKYLKQLNQVNHQNQQQQQSHISEDRIKQHHSSSTNIQKKIHPHQPPKSHMQSQNHEMGSTQLYNHTQNTSTINLVKHNQSVNISQSHNNHKKSSNSNNNNHHPHNQSTSSNYIQQQKQHMSTMQSQKNIQKASKEYADSERIKNLTQKINEMQNGLYQRQKTNDSMNGGSNFNQSMKVGHTTRDRVYSHHQGKSNTITSHRPQQQQSYNNTGNSFNNTQNHNNSKYQNYNKKQVSGQQQMGKSSNNLGGRGDQRSISVDGQSKSTQMLKNKLIQNNHHDHIQSNTLLKTYNKVMLNSKQQYNKQQNYQPQQHQKSFY